MSQNTSLIQQYELIACITNKMVNQAKANHWDSVIELGTAYHDAVESLRSLLPLNTEDRNARRKLLTQILDNDASIRRLASPELDRLGLLIGTMKRQQSVVHTYCAPSLNS